MTSISSRYLLTLVQQLEAAGVPPTTIAETLDLDIKALETAPDESLPLTLYSRLYQFYLQKMTAENFAFPDTIGETRGRYQMLLTLMVNSDTLKSALRKLHDFYQTFAINHQLIRYHSDTQGDIHCELTILMREKFRNTQQQTAIAANLATAFHRVLCWLTETRLPLRKVELEGALPENTNNYRSLFDCPLSFASASTQLHYPKQVLECGIVQNEQSLATFLDQFPTVLFEPPQQREQTLSLKIESLILHNLKERLLNIEDASQMLNMSQAKLKSTLRSEGTSFHQLLEIVRRDQAIDWLVHSGMDLKLIAEQLGFPATSAFHRSFKRWTGQTPGDYRKQQAR